jgi:hypothetical protein
MIRNPVRSFQMIGLTTGLVLALGHGATAGEATGRGALRLGSTQMVKLVVPQPLASNRLEYDYVYPLHESSSSRIFVDTKVFAQQKPLIDSGNSAFIDSYGQSVRVGIRNLFNDGNAFRGASIGYDSLQKDGAYFQQIGGAIEYTKQSYQLVLTAGIPFSPPNAQLTGSTPLASVNLQLSLPTGYPGLDIQPRIYYAGSDKSGSAVGGQLQFTYTFSGSWSATLASNYDALTGVSGSLTFQVLLPQRTGRLSPQGINPDLVYGFSGAVGNNGSRVIRLDNVPASSGN